VFAAGSRGSNVLVGGLFLHQRRRPVPTPQQAAAACSGRFANLEFGCQYASALEVGGGCKTFQGVRGQAQLSSRQG